MPYAGELLAMLTALTWAVAVVFFKKSGETVHPIALNLLKNVLAVMLFVPTIWLMGETMLHEATLGEYGLMMLGGVLGLAVADTMFFISLNLLGASLMAIVDCMYSPFIIVFSVIFLGETLGPVQVAGVLLILGAVLMPAFEKPKVGADHRRFALGALWGAGALSTMAISLVMVKPLLDRSPVLWASTIRMLGGVVALGVYLVLHPGRRQILGTLRGKGLAHTIVGSVIGGYLAMMLWLGGMKYTKASVAAALNQTSNVFLFILAAVILKEIITRQKLAGIVMGVGGALLVTFG